MKPRNDAGLISVALTYVVLASSVVMVALSWFLLSQAQASDALQQDRNDVAIQETNARLLNSINTKYDPAWLTMTAAQLQTPSTTTWRARASTDVTTAVTKISSPDPQTITVTITATSTKDPTLTMTKQMTYRAVGVFAYSGASADSSGRPLWTTRPSQNIIGLFELAGAQQVTR